MSAARALRAPLSPLLSPATLSPAPLVALWNRSVPADEAISERLLAWACAPDPERAAGAWLLGAPEEPLGLALASHGGLGGPGWIDALLVQPGRGRQPAMQRLLHEALLWLRAGGVAQIVVGGGPRSLTRGAQTDARARRFYARHHFQDAGVVEDLALNVAGYAPPADMEAFPGVARPAQPRDRDELDALLQRALLDVSADALASGPALGWVRALLAHGRQADLMLLWSARGLEGLALPIFADSLLPIELAYPYRLPRPWSALGPLLVRADAAPGAATLLLDATLRRLHNNGANGCVALAVDNRAFYNLFGFGPYRAWQRWVLPV